jgi:hypothetical protein
MLLKPMTFGGIRMAEADDLHDFRILAGLRCCGFLKFLESSERMTAPFIQWLQT